MNGTLTPNVSEFRLTKKKFNIETAFFFFLMCFITKQPILMNMFTFWKA